MLSSDRASCVAMRGYLVVFALFVVVTCNHECDTDTTCEDGETCCRIRDDTWGCCPIENAVCCSDHLHCCPRGTTCDIEEARCLQSSGNVFPISKKRPATRRQTKNEHNEVLCPDHESKCPEKTTCCMLEQGTYGCCPAPEAVCCADHLHCCPKGFRCNGQFCLESSIGERRRAHKKFPSTPIKKKPAIEFMSYDHESNSEEVERDESYELLPEELKPIACGYQKTCPAKTTCCTVERLGRLQSMCCPLNNAVCCADTCCPQGYHCVGGGKCEKRAVRHKNMDDSYRAVYF